MEPIKNNDNDTMANNNNQAIGAIEERSQSIRETDDMTDANNIQLVELYRELKIEMDKLMELEWELFNQLKDVALRSMRRSNNSMTRQRKRRNRLRRML